MAPKVKGKVCEKKRSKKMISMEVKHEIIAKHERGVRITDMLWSIFASLERINTFYIDFNGKFRFEIRFF